MLSTEIWRTNYWTTKDQWFLAAEWNLSVTALNKSITNWLCSNLEDATSKHRACYNISHTQTPSTAAAAATVHRDSTMSCVTKWRHIVNFIAQRADNTELRNHSRKDQSASNSAIYAANSTYTIHTGLVLAQKFVTESILYVKPKNMNSI